MSENSTKNSIRAASGQTRLTRSSFQKPDTVVILPDGKTLVLGRHQDKGSMPVFRKLNPRKYDLRTGRAKNKKDDASPFAQSSKIPFTKFLLTAALMYQAVAAAKAWWRRFQQWRNRDIIVIGEEETDEQYTTAEVQDAEARLRAAMLPAMMRSAMPKPQRQSLAHQQAMALKAKARHLPTAKKMMEVGDSVKRKKPGKLGKLDQVMKDQVRQLTMSQQQSAQLQLEAVRRMLALQAPPVASSAAGQAAAASAVNEVNSSSMPRQNLVIDPAEQPVRKR